MSSAPVLEVRGLARRFGRVRALRGVDLVVRAGESVLVVGPNGAGKSTLLRVVAGLARPDSGRVLLQGRPLGAEPDLDRRAVGYAGHHGMLYEALSTRENLAFAGRLHGVPQLRSRIDQLLRAMDLEARADDPVGELSRGFQQRAALARALLHDPAVLLLDEPHAGLDARACEVLEGLLAALRRRGRTLLLVTHDVQRGLRVADRVVALAGGRVSADRPASGLVAAELEDELARAGEPGAPTMNDAMSATR